MVRAVTHGATGPWLTSHLCINLFSLFGYELEVTRLRTSPPKTAKYQHTLTERYLICTAYA